MRMNVIRSVVLVSLLTAGAALATHPLDPIDLVQRYDNATGAILPTSTTVFEGQTIHVTATWPGGTNGTATYNMELEIREVSQAFTGTPTHSAGTFIGTKSASNLEAPGLTYQPGPGVWKWQARMTSSVSGAPSPSGWVPFNGGQAAFTVAPMTVPDLLVEEVTLTNRVSNQSIGSLELAWSARFRNRGGVPTNVNGGMFTWKAYISTDKVLDPSSDRLIYTSTSPLMIGASTTLTQTASVVLNPAPRAGTYYILVEVDPPTSYPCNISCGNVDEFDELNNVGATPNTFTSGVDLVAVSLTGEPATSGPGQTVTLTANFRNDTDETPPANQNPVVFRIWTSRDPTVGPDTMVYENSITVAGGTTFNAPISFVLPPGVSGGDVYWLLQVDATKKVVEAREDNNTALSATKTRIVQADLQVNEVDLVDVLTGVSTRQADMGQPARFDVVIENVGDLAAIPFDIGVAISRDTTASLLPSSDEIFADVAISGMPMPTSGNPSKRIEQLVVNMPTKLNGQPLQTGDYYFFVHIDSKHAINEVKEDNFKFVLGPVRLRRPAADYRVARVETPSTAAAGEVMQLARTFANVGTDDGAQVEYRCFASANTILSTGDFPLEFVEPDGSTVPSRKIQLNRGQSDARTETVRLQGSMPAGDFYMGCLIDPENALPELDETNNSAVTYEKVKVSPQTFRIVTQQLPDATIATPYSVQLVSAGNHAPVTWALKNGTQQLPEGMILSTSGVLSGTATTLGTSTFMVTATSGNASFDAVLVARVLPASSQLAITTDSLPPIVNSSTIPYQAVLSVSGGAAPYHWSILSGTLPQGITMADNGNITGAPRAGLVPTETMVTFQVRDVNGGVARKALRVKLLPPGALAIATLALPEEMVGGNYAGSLTANVVGGGTVAKPLTWSILEGTLPAGISLTMHSDQATGLLQGTPQEAGSFPVTIQVTDANERFDTADFIVRIHSGQLKVFAENAPTASLFAGDTVDFAVLTDSTAAVKFRQFSGSPPPGVTITEDGKVSGTIDADETVSVGRHNFVVEAVDARGAKGLAAFSIDVQKRVANVGCSSTGAGGTSFVLVALLGLAVVLGRRRFGVR